VRQYPLCRVLVSHTDTPYAFHPVNCTMSKFNMFHRAKLFAHTIEHTVSRQLILILCAYQQNSFMLINNCTPHVHITMCVLTVQGSIQRMHPHIIIFHAVRQFTVHTCTPTFFVRFQNLPCVPKMPTFFYGCSLT
jgi:hypothetical protein